MQKACVLLVSIGTLLAACAPAPEALRRQAVLRGKDAITLQLTTLREAVQELQTATPQPDADGWNTHQDREAVLAMRGAWVRARDAYERVEGSIAILFPETDFSADARYEDFVESQPDTELFDGSGVTGMHAIERILWSDSMPEHVRESEAQLSHYEPARFPHNAQEASAFRDQLVGRLLQDVTTLEAEFRPLALDADTLFQGIIGSMEEQSEKVALAETASEESRYAKHTLGDMRSNLAGASSAFQAFRPWIVQVQGEAQAEAIETALGRLQQAYAALPGNSIPDLPEAWNPDSPTPAQLQSPYGVLYTEVHTEAAADVPTSLVGLLRSSGHALGLAVP